jgi:lactate dehydrogenase-like 2-hydroxyacid dehydrogenase
MQAWCTNSKCGPRWPVNEAALYDALVSGHVAAAGIDVFDKEPSYDKKPGEQNYETSF